MNPDPADRLHSRYVYLLNGLRLIDSRGEIDIPSGKARSLLVCLALSRGRLEPRERLVALLWPEAAPERGGRYLSDLVYRLRSVLGDAWLEVEKDRLALRSGPDVWVDAWEFERLLAQDDALSLARAAALYQGDLAPEVYEDWILLDRLALREHYQACLLRLGQSAEARGDAYEAEDYYRRLVRLEPLREDARRGLMRSLAKAGRLREALDAYADLQAQLKGELDVPPSPETNLLADQLRIELELAHATRTQSDRVPLLGRFDERARLLQRLEQAQNGQGGLVVLLGEAGIGKTRLLEELAQAADWRGWQAVWGRVEEFSLPAPYEPFFLALRDGLPAVRVEQILRLVKANHLSALSSLLPQLQIHLPTTDKQAPAYLPEEVLFSGVLRLLDALQHIRPHLLLLDDIQWADAAFWPLLDRLQTHLRQRSILVVLAGRLTELRAQESSWAYLDKWDRAGSVVMELKGLSLDALAELARLQQVQIQDTQLQALAAASGGNPLYALEVLRSGNLERLWQEKPSLADLASQHLATLSSQAQYTLQAAAVLGYRFEYGLWEAMLERANFDLEQLPRLCGEIERAGLLQPAAGGYRFHHDAARAAICFHLPPGAGRQWHAHALAVLQQQPAAAPQQMLYHARQAGEQKAIADFAFQAGGQALASFAYQAAIEYFSLALEALPVDDVDRRYQALVGRQQACAVLGETERQRTDLASMQELAQRSGRAMWLAQVTHRQAEFAWLTGDQPEAQRLSQVGLRLVQGVEEVDLQAALLETLGKVARNFGDYQQSRFYMDKAYQSYRLAGDLFGQASTLDKLANLNCEQHEYQQAERQHRQAADIFHTIGAITHEGRALNGLALALRGMNDFHQARLVHLQVLAAAREAGDQDNTWSQMTNLGNLAMELGDYPGAVDWMQQALQVCRQVGHERGISLILNNLGLAYNELGDLAQAEQHYQESLRINRARGYRRGEAHNLSGLGVALLNSGEWERALLMLETAREIWEDLADRSEQIEALAGLAMVNLEMGQTDRAQEHLQQALARAHLQPEDASLRQWLHYVAYRVYQHQGQTEQGMQHLLEACRAMLEIADALPEADREHFLQQATVNKKMRQALETHTRRVSVRLARLEAPVGRKLEDDELCLVEWTVFAPQDNLIEAASERRLQVLARLLHEANQQGAAPTDDDLAQALGVNRRTILRDMKILSARGVDLPTRGRAR